MYRGCGDGLTAILRTAAADVRIYSWPIPPEEWAKMNPHPAVQGGAQGHYNSSHKRDACLESAS